MIGIMLKSASLAGHMVQGTSVRAMVGKGERGNGGIHRRLHYAEGGPSNKHQGASSSQS